MLHGEKKDAAPPTTANPKRRYGDTVLAPAALEKRPPTKLT